MQAVSDDRVFETRLGPTQQPWLEDHRILGTLRLPSPVYMEMALAAAAQLFGDGPLQIDDLTLHQALPLDADTGTSVQLVLAPPQPNGQADFRICTHEGRTSATGKRACAGASCAAAWRRGVR